MKSIISKKTVISRRRPQRFNTRRYDTRRRSNLLQLYALCFGAKQVQPDLVLVNGPGTCLPIAVSAFFFRIVGWKPETKIVFVESFCRVTR